VSDANITAADAERDDEDSEAGTMLWTWVGGDVGSDTLRTTPISNVWWRYNESHPCPAPVTLFPHQTLVVAIRQQFKSYTTMVSRMLVMVQ